MPTIQREDTFSHADFTVPGGGFYGYVEGTPTYSTSNPPPHDAGEMVCAAAGAAVRVASLYSSDPQRAWRGFWLRINTATEPNLTTTIGTLWDASFAVNAKLFWDPTANGLIHAVEAGAGQTIAVSLDAWHWVEQIFDATTTTGTSLLRVDGVQATNATDPIAAATAMHFDELGPAGNTGTVQIGHHYWGSAANNNDWLGVIAPIAWTVG